MTGSEEIHLLEGIQLERSEEFVVDDAPALRSRTSYMHCLEGEGDGDQQLHIRQLVVLQKCP